MPPPLRSAPLVLGLACAAAAAAAGADEWFVDITPRVGIDFLHQDGRTGEKYYLETAGSGAAWLDLEGDGDLDLFLVNGAPAPGVTLRPTPRNALYERRDGRFVEVTEAAGVGAPGHGMGACVGDVDADGRQDLLVTYFGPDRLYRNLGGGRFEEIAARAGVADPRWSASCAFGDLDGDGDLDLYVTHYVDFAFERNPFCGDRARGLRAYCRPEAFDGVTDSLFVNQGDGTFRDEAAARGIAQGADEKGFGVVLSDLDDDGDLDIYVANDGTMNRLYVNDGDGRFADHSLLSGTGLNRLGRAESGMGVDAGDVDADGALDLLVTNYSMESNTLYRNLGGLLFEDATPQSGLVEASYKLVGWGAALFDADNDGDLDLAVANGHAIDNIELFEPVLAYRQRNQLFVNDGGGRFADASARAGAAWQRAGVGRGLAVGDWNDDGRLDLLLTHTNDRAALLENRLATAGRWLGLVLRGPAANALAIGARVRVTAGDRVLVREVRSGGSFLSQGDLRLHFGLGAFAGPVAVEVRWPDGRRQRRTLTALDAYQPLAYAPDPD